MKRTPLRLQSLEARDVPNGTQLFAVAEDASPSRVAVYQAAGESEFFTRHLGPTQNLVQQGTLLTTFAPYPGFGGGVRLAVGDVTGDGVDDVITGAGFGGGPHIKIFDGAQLLNGHVIQIKEFFAFDNAFKGGVFVAVGQIDPATPQKEIIVGAGESGGPHVRVFSVEPIFFIAAPSDPNDYYRIQTISEFFAYDKDFRGGVRVAAADVDGDGRDDVVTGAGPGGGPHVRVFNVYPPNPLALYPASHTLLDEFYAYDSGFHGGVYVAAGNVTGDAKYAEVITGAGEGGGPHVKVFSNEASGRMTKIAETFAGSPSLTSGVRVGLADLGNNPAAASPQARPFTIYVGHGFDPAAISVAGTESRLGAYNFHFGSLAAIELNIPVPFDKDSNGSLNVGE